MNDSEEIIYEVLKDEWEKILPVACYHYTKDDTSCRGLHMEVKDLEEPLTNSLKSWTEKGTTVVAKCKSSGAIVGVKIFLIVERGKHEAQWSALKPITNKKVHNFTSYLKVVEDAIDIFEEDPSLNLLMEHIILSVHPDFRGKGIGRNLVKKSDEIAVEAGCQKSTVCVTGVFSHAVFSKQGYKERFELDCETFQLNGEYIFDVNSMGDTKKMKLLVKQF